jgi:small subunit ribosomal protein S1
VLDVDLDRERVSLSLKATQEDPWKEFERQYQAGEIIDGEVTKLVPFGAFVRVAQGIEGLVHISELAEGHVESPEAVLSVGDGVRVKVIDVDVSRRRVSLSMRQVGGQVAPVSEREIEEERPEPQGPEPSQRPESPQGQEPGAAAPAEPTPEAQQAATPTVGDAEPEETPEPQPPEPAPAAPEASPEPAAPAAPEEAEGEVSLESILRDLKRREGRTD